MKDPVFFFQECYFKVATCKGIQDSLGFWIPRRGLQIPRYWIPVFGSGTWILDCSR